MKNRQSIVINCKKGKKIFFSSDQHFKISKNPEYKIRETIFINFLDSIKYEADIIFLLGDFFDLWYEYKHVIPKGFIRILGKLAELTDLGIQFFLFKGNHELYLDDYLKKELNFNILQQETEFIIDNYFFLIGHGDGLGPFDIKYKYIKKLLNHQLIQFLFKWIHPDIGLPIAKYFAKKNKILSSKSNNLFLEEKESLIQYSKFELKKKHYDYFIFGHRHLPLKIPINNSIYFNLGDWIIYYTYLEYYEKKIQLKKWKI